MTDNTLTKATELLDWISSTFGTQTLYRNAAVLATVQLDRPFSPQDIARIEACLYQARIAIRPDLTTQFADLAGLAALAATLPPDKIDRIAPNARLEEALDDTGKRIAKAFAPAMPKIDNPTP